MASLDINTEEYQESIDYLSTLDNVDRERIGNNKTNFWNVIDY